MFQPMRKCWAMFVCIGSSASSLATEPAETSLRDEDQRLKVVYSGDEAPDGIVFQSILYRASAGDEQNSDTKLRYVMRKMDFEDIGEAERFVRALEREKKKLQKAKLQAKHQYTCTSRPSRTPDELFRDLDELTNVEITLADLAYESFSASISDEHAAKLRSWIDESKSGFRYVVPSAKFVTEKMGVDPVAHYKTKCIEISQRIAGAK